MKNLLFIIFPFTCSISNYNSSTTGLDEIAKSTFTRPISINEPDNFISFDEIESEYDTLIPIFDGLFITYDNVDTILFRKFQSKNNQEVIWNRYTEYIMTKDTKKWGVIDSTGNIIVPFICDGAKAIAQDTGLVSIYSTSASLNTGIPRYKYFGTYFFFTKNGLLSETEKNFEMTVEYIADWHRSEFVTTHGPEFFLPNEYASRFMY